MLRSARSLLLAASLTGMGTATGTAAHAHLELVEPTARLAGTAGGQLKVPPCGQATNARTDRVTEYEPGATIVIEWSEYVDHPSYYRIAFDADGDDGFPVRPDTDSVVEAEDDPATIHPIGDEVLAYVFEEPDLDRYSVEVTLPQVECEACTLQVIQFMYDKVGDGAENELYYQCADLVLRRAGGAGGGGEGGAGGGPSSSGGAGGSAGLGTADPQSSGGEGGVGSPTSGGTGPSGSVMGGASGGGSSGTGGTGWPTGGRDESAGAGTLSWAGGETSGSTPGLAGAGSADPGIGGAPAPQGEVGAATGGGTLEDNAVLSTGGTQPTTLTGLGSGTGATGGAMATVSTGGSPDPGSSTPQGASPPFGGTGWASVPPPGATSAGSGSGGTGPVAQEIRPQSSGNEGSCSFVPVPVSGGPGAMIGLGCLIASCLGRGRRRSESPATAGGHDRHRGGRGSSTRSTLPRSSSVPARITSRRSPTE